MIYLKIYEEFDYSDELIHEIFKKYGITDYIIDNGMIVIGSITECLLKKIPIKYEIYKNI